MYLFVSCFLFIYLYIWSFHPPYANEVGVACTHSEARLVTPCDHSDSTVLVLSSALLYLPDNKATVPLFKFEFVTFNSFNGIVFTSHWRWFEIVGERFTEPCTQWLSSLLFGWTEWCLAKSQHPLGYRCWPRSDASLEEVQCQLWIVSDADQAAIGYPSYY